MGAQQGRVACPPPCPGQRTPRARTCLVELQAGLSGSSRQALQARGHLFGATSQDAIVEEGKAELWSLPHSSQTSRLQGSAQGGPGCFRNMSQSRRRSTKDLCEIGRGWSGGCSRSGSSSRSSGRPSSSASGASSSSAARLCAIVALSHQ